MANDNPEKYKSTGGVHLQRLTRAQCVVNHLDPEVPWLVIAVTDQKTEQVAYIGEDTARKLAAGIEQLLAIKL